MIVFLIILLILLVIASIPLGVAARYDQEGFAAQVKVGPFPVFSLPRPPKDKPAGEKKGDKKSGQKKAGQKKAEQAEQTEPKKGGPLDLARAALPLVKDALVGIKRRLVIRDLELQVTWAASNPADAAIGYGYANMALGSAWTVIDQLFKVKRSRLGCGVDFDATSPTLYAKGVITVTLGQVVTLALPLALRFFRNTARLQKARTEKTKKEA